MLKLTTFLTTIAATSLIALPLLAASPIGNVGTARVDENALYTEWRGGYTWEDAGGSNDKRFRMREHIDYGFNDWYAVRIIASQDKRNAAGIEHGAVTFENRIQLIEQRDYGWDGGIRLIYGHSDGDKTPHEIDVRLMAQVPFGENNKWEFRHNTVIEHDVGENSQNGFALEWRHQVTRSITPPDFLSKLRVGIELFNDLGRLNALSGYDAQDHQVGPVMKGYVSNGVYFQAGYRAGASDAGVDHLAKLFIGKKF